MLTDRLTCKETTNEHSRGILNHLLFSFSQTSCSTTAVRLLLFVCNNADRAELAASVRTRSRSVRQSERSSKQNALHTTGNAIINQRNRNSEGAITAGADTIRTIVSRRRHWAPISQVLMVAGTQYSATIALCNISAKDRLELRSIF